MGVVCLGIYFNVFVHSYSRLRFRLSAFQMERTNFCFIIFFFLSWIWTILLRKVSSIARRSTGSVRKVVPRQVMNGDSIYGRSAVAMRTDGLPDGWVLRLHRRGNLSKKGLCYRTVTITEPGCSACTVLRWGFSQLRPSIAPSFVSRKTECKQKISK